MDRTFKKGKYHEFSKIHKKISNRIKKDRDSLRLSQEMYVSKIQYENHHCDLNNEEQCKKLCKTGFTRSNLSNIEKGNGSRNLLSNKQIDALVKARFSSRLDLLLGKTEERKKLLSDFLFTLLLNGHKLDIIKSNIRKGKFRISRKNKIKHVNTFRKIGKTFDIPYENRIEQLSNLLIKIMLSDRTFFQNFTKIFFYHSNQINYTNYKGNKKEFKEVVKQLEDWYSKNTGNLLPLLTVNKSSSVIFVKTASNIIEEVTNFLLPDIEKKIEDVLRDLDSFETSNQFQKEKKILFRITETLFIELLCSIETFYKLEKYIQLLQIRTETGLQYTTFLHNLEYQKEIVKRLLQLESSSSRQYNHYQVESDILSLIDFYNDKQNSPIQNNQPLDLFIDDLTFNRP
ncbi:hypothetical protein HPA19_07735 [Streptococcus suis]|nr:hypothetical protein [Streptococcus suis]